MRRRRGSIVLKSPREIEIMRTANQHTAEVLQMMAEAAVPGVSTWDLDQIARKEIKKRPVKSAFLGYYDYPAVICASVNHVIVHGIPNKKTVLQEGDIIGLDFGLVYEGYVGDTAKTVVVGGKTKPEAQQLVDVTRDALEAAIELCTPEHRLSDLGKVISDKAKVHSYGVVREFVGHGVGTAMHEDPQVPNYYAGPLPRLRVGLVIAIEPMLNLGTHQAKVLDDEWTAVTTDGSLSAHFEHSVAITEQGPQVLSRL